MQVDVNGRAATATLTVCEEPSLCGKRAAELKQFGRNVRSESNGKTPDLASTRASPSLIGQAAQPDKAETRKYACEHNIPGVVQGMLHQVLCGRPEAPYAFMSEYLRKCSLEHGEPQENSESAADVERVRLEAVHLALRQQRTNLLKELSELEALALGSDLVTASSQ